MEMRAGQAMFGSKFSGQLAVARVDVYVRSLTFILLWQDLVNGVFPIEDESVEAQLVVQGFLRILKRNKSTGQSSRNDNVQCDRRYLKAKSTCEVLIHLKKP